MEYTITNNADFGSIEITFDGKPEQAIRDALKALRFRWHGVKKVWYGYKDEATVRAAIEGRAEIGHETANKAESKPAANKYGVQMGDIFSASWGYDQTSVNFFQVVSLVGEASIRVREVCPQVIAEQADGPMSCHKTYKIERKILPPSRSSVFIKDQQRGDVKRLKSFARDGVSNPLFKLDTFANAYLCEVGEREVFESWYG